eukprot:Cvel_27685.t1-p1 / transcript=Cvel_27685.t1 / gene=Cvel_27685 / organism=Chromera_velia_CCMP2878 / gene_product=hypothetical protein / transcript_product=hypothetical protein / location=Cvel_scaffold3494:775-5754(-) / protein_length=613 / sequence_SO=supercontig / SO=protein_coding / is_pseudo=false
MPVKVAKARVSRFLFGEGGDEDSEEPEQHEDVFGFGEGDDGCSILWHATGADEYALTDLQRSVGKLGGLVFLCERSVDASLGAAVSLFKTAIEKSHEGNVRLGAEMVWMDLPFVFGTGGQAPRASHLAKSELKCVKKDDLIALLGQEVVRGCIAKDTKMFIHIGDLVGAADLGRATELTEKVKRCLLFEQAALVMVDYLDTPDEIILDDDPNGDESLDTAPLRIPAAVLVAHNGDPIFRTGQRLTEAELVREVSGVAHDKRRVLYHERNSKSLRDLWGALLQRFDERGDRATGKWVALFGVSVTQVIPALDLAPNVFTVTTSDALDATQRSAVSAFTRQLKNLLKRVLMKPALRPPAWKLAPSLLQAVEVLCKQPVAQVEDKSRKIRSGGGKPKAGSSKKPPPENDKAKPPAENDKAKPPAEDDKAKPPPENDKAKPPPEADEAKPPPENEKAARPTRAAKERAKEKSVKVASSDDDNGDEGEGDSDDDSSPPKKAKAKKMTGAKSKAKIPQGGGAGGMLDALAETAGTGKGEKRLSRTGTHDGKVQEDGLHHKEKKTKDLPKAKGKGKGRAEGGEEKENSKSSSASSFSSSSSSSSSSGGKKRSRQLKEDNE